MFNRFVLFCLSTSLCAGKQAVINNKNTRHVVFRIFFFNSISFLQKTQRFCWRFYKIRETLITMIFFYNRIINSFDNFSSNTRHSEVLAHSDFKMVLSLTTAASEKTGFLSWSKKRTVKLHFRKIAFEMLNFNRRIWIWRGSEPVMTVLSLSWFQILRLQL